MPVGLRWLCHQFEMHLEKKYSASNKNIESKTTVFVLDFVFTSMVLPILHNSPLWVDVAVQEKWGVTIENRTDKLYWTSDRLRALKDLWSGKIRPEIHTRVRRNVFWATSLLHRTIIDRPLDQLASPWLVGANRSIEINTHHGVMAARKVLEAAGDVDMQNTMLTDMFREHIRKTPLVLQMPMKSIEYLRYALLFMGPKFFPSDNVLAKLLWRDNSILGDEGMKNAARNYNPMDTRYTSYPVYINYSVDLAHLVDMRTESNTSNGSEDNNWTEDTTVVSHATKCILPRKLAIGRPHHRFLFGEDISHAINQRHIRVSSDTYSDSDDDDDDTSGFSSPADVASKKLKKIENQIKATKILEARRIAHIKARDGLQEFLRDPSTKLVDILGNGHENPVYIMMRLVKQR